ncbi:hypothetical protein [Pedobacter sp. HMWF019]|uniref:hypothetical protein n=1 Tax=Pedobacter sp. HMWF019 TaxID=2056856 RepID=UPI0011B1FCDC|nr:hypothetical protein [Pedobacter sp. HMWF019]
MKKFMANQVKEFENVFGQGNVNAQMLIREVKSADQLNDFESLIDIQAGNKFEKTKDGKTIGGDAQMGGKFLRLNSESIDEKGNFIDKKTLIHEIGHTGGLYHTFEPKKEGKLANGKPAPGAMQSFYNSSNSPYVEANFMNYTSNAVDAGTLGPSVNAVRFFNNTVGKATQGQVQTIVTNLYNGNLNYNNIPKKK